MKNIGKHIITSLKPSGRLHKLFRLVLQVCCLKTFHHFPSHIKGGLVSFESEKTDWVRLVLKVIAHPKKKKKLLQENRKKNVVVTWWLFLI